MGYERNADNEVAKYKCLDSGQGCGGSTHEVTISGNLVQSTEGLSKSFASIEISQSYRSGLSTEFMWMHLDESDITFLYSS